MNAISYIRNVGKSFGYIAVDVIKDYNPAATALAQSAKDLGSDLYQSVSDFKANLATKTSEIGLKDEAKSVTREFGTNLFEDLKSGKWYNTDRVNKAALDQFESFGDFSFNDDDFGDFEFEDENDSTKVEMAQDQMNTKALINSMDVVGAKTANAVTTATVKSAEYVVTAQRESTRALYGITSRGFTEVTRGIASLNAGVASLASIAEPINIHIQNSTNFYTRSTEYQEKTLKLLEQLVKNTSATHSASRQSSRQKNTIEDFMSGGVIDLNAYYKMVSDNIKDVVGLYGSLLGIGGGIGGGIKNNDFVKSPISSLLKASIKGLTPKIMKKSMEEFNEYLDGFFATMLGSLKDKNPTNPILSLLKDFFVPKSGYKDKIDTSKYNKGKVDWDGMSRQALMEVIPHQLSQIVAVLTGKPQEKYDYQKGRWVKTSSVDTDFKKIKNRYADDAGYEFMSDVKAVIDELKNQNKYNENQVKVMKEQLDQFNRIAFHSDNSEFTKFMDSDFNYSKYGLDKETWQLFKAIAKDYQKNGKRSKITKYTGNIMRDRAKFGNTILDIEADGSSAYNMLFNGATIIKEDERGRTLLGVDEYNNDIFYYLQGIYQSTTHVSDNLHLLIPNGRSTKGTKINKNSRIEPIRSITRKDKIDNSSVDDKRSSFVDLGSLSSEQLEELLANMNDKTKSGKKLPPKSNSKLRDYAKMKYNSIDGNYEKDDNLEKELEAWEKSQETISDIKNKIGNTTIGKTVLNFSESILKLLNTPAEAVTKLLNAAEVSMDRLLTGNKEDGEKGILDLAKEGFGNLFEDLNEKLNSIFPIDKMKSFINKLFGKKGEDGKRSGTSFSGFANATSDELRGVGRWFKNIFTGSKGSVDQAARGRKVTRTGLVAVSEGELIIPSELNPFYKGKTNKNRELSREREAIDRFFGSYSKGTTQAGVNGEEPLSEDGTGKTSGFANNSFLGWLLSTLKDGGKTLAKGAGQVFENIVPNKEQAKKEKGKISKVVQTALEELGASKGAVGAGALIGGGVSLLTGGLISPILGAGIGAAGGLIIKSKAVQDILFGTEDEPGLLKKETADFIKDHVPDMGKGAAVGGAAGLFMGSPVMGAILGSAIGYIKSSTEAQERLFGGNGFGKEGVDSGMISKDLQMKIKKAVPTMSAGAILGLVAGPFGSIPANLIMGSALGFAAQTDKFKDWMFGDEKDENGKRKNNGGFVGLLKDKFVTPLLDIFARLGEQIKHTVRDTFHNLSKALRKTLTNFLKGGLGRRVVRGAKTVGRGLNRVTGGLFNKLGDGIVGVRDHMTNKALRKGYDVYDTTLGRNLTAKEREERRAKATEKGRRAGQGQVYSNYDQFLMNASEDEIKDVDAIMKKLIDPTKEFDNRIRSSRSAANRILTNSRDALYGSNNTKDNRKKFVKVSDLISKGDFDKALKLVEELEMDEDNRSALIVEIKKNQQAYQDRDNAKSDSKAARKVILGDSKYRHLFDHVTDSDLMNMRDLNKTELKSLSTPEAREARVQDATVESRDILKNILSVMIHGPESISSDVRNSLSPSGRATVRQIINDRYNEDGREYKQGDKRTDAEGREQIFNGTDWEYNMDHEGTREDVENEEKLTNALLETAENTRSLTGMDKLFGFFGGNKSNNNNNDSNEENSGLLDSLSGMNNGVGTVAGILKSIVPGLKSLGKWLALFGTYVAVGTGAFDPVAEALQMGGDADNETFYGSTGYTDQQNNPLTKGEDGKLYNADGTEYTGQVYAGQSEWSRATNPFSSNFWLNEGRQFLTQGRNFTTEIIRKMPFGLGEKFLNFTSNKLGFTNLNQNLFNQSTGLLSRLDIGSSVTDSGKVVFSEGAGTIARFDITDSNKTTRTLVTETAENSAEKLAREGAEATIERSAKKQLMERVQEAIEKFIKNIDKFPYGKKLLASIDLDKFGKKLFSFIGEKVAKGSARAVADCTYAIPVVGLVLDVVFFVADFCEGWNDATEYFKVLEATEWQKLISGMACALFGLIPFIGPLIPIGLLVDLTLSALEAIGVDLSELRFEQELANKELEGYNEYHGTDLSFSDYSKNVAGNKGFFEELWSTGKTQTSTNWNILTTSVKNTINGDYGNTPSSILSGIWGNATDQYQKMIWNQLKDKIELELRTEMREEEGTVDETRLQEILKFRIDTFLYSEDGKKWFVYEYGDQNYETFRSNYEASLENTGIPVIGTVDWDASHSSGINYIGTGRRFTGGNNMGGASVRDTSAGSSGLINNFVSQVDSKYANMSIGGINDVQSKGCGPAAAVMALNQYAGNANMDSAVKVAGNYQTSGGTDAAFFADYYKKHGVNASYYDGTSSAGQSNIINSISNGVPVILMGRDYANTSKANSPFGPNNHYVVASGFDGSGNIIINDPESRRANKIYSSKILKNVKLGIGMSGAGSKILRLGFSGGSTTVYPHTLRNDATTQMIWSILKAKGYSDAAIAGIMGNLQQESGIDPTRYQLNGGPGRGLAQWTVGERHNDLINYAKTMGRDWTDLEAQTLFIDYEICGTQRNFFKNKGYPVDEFKKIDDPALATEIFEKAYERAGNPNMSKRVEYAVYYYNEFSGKTYDYSGTYVPTLIGTTSTSESEISNKPNGILDNILSFFDNKLGSLFGIKHNNTNNQTVAKNEPAINNNPTSITYSGSTPVELMKSIKNKLLYSMDGPRDPEQGSADCSSTVRWAIKKATGIDIGGNTASQYNNSNLKTVWYNNGNIATSVPSNIKENDVLFFSRPKSDYTIGRKDRVGHVELYAGNNQMIGHGGGGDGYGPKLKDLVLSGNNGGLIKVARLGTGAAGSGLIDASALGRTSKAIYNRGSNNVVEFNPTTGEYKVGKLYSGGGSKVTVRNTNISAGSSGISKDVALLLKTIITLIETLVTNTNDIHNIYEVLVQFIDGRNIDANTASKAKAALNALNTQSGSSDSSRIESQLSGLKAQVDSILAS